MFGEVVDGLRRLKASQLSIVADLVRVLGPVDEAVDAEVPAVVLGAIRVEAAVQGSAAPWLRRFDSSLRWAADGARSPAAWVSRRVPVSTQRAGAALKRARVLATRSLVSRSFGRGRIGPEQVRMLLDVESEVPGTFADQEAYLVATVETLSVAGTAVFLSAWLLEARPDGGDEAALKDRSDTHLSFGSTLGGTVVKGWLDPETAAIVQGALDAEIEAMHRAGLLEGDTRTRSQLYAEAWRNLAARLGRTGDQHGQPRPLALLLIDADTAAGRRPGAGRCAGSTAGPGAGPDHAVDPAPADRTSAGCPERRDGAGPATDRDEVVETGRVEVQLDPGRVPRRVSELVGQGPVPGSTARRLLCDADVSEVSVADRGRTVLDVGFTHRLATPAQRRALIVRAGGTCECPGCDAPYTWCQAHHLEPFDPVARTGPTDLQNLAWLCHRHHHLVHEGGFGLIRGPTGELELHRPDGGRVEIALRDRP